MTSIDKLRIPKGMLTAEHQRRTEQIQIRNHGSFVFKHYFSSSVPWILFLRVKHGCVRSCVLRGQDCVKAPVEGETSVGSASHTST